MNRVDMDFVLLVCGLACGVLFPFCWVLNRVCKDKIAWLWFGLFGLFYGGAEWMLMLQFGLGESGYLDAAYLILVFFAFLSLFEFGRSSMPVFGSRTCSRMWLLLPIGLALPSSQLIGLELKFALVCVLGVPGVLWAIWVLARLSSQRSNRRKSLWLAIAGMIGFGWFMVWEALPWSFHDLALNKAKSESLAFKDGATVICIIVLVLAFYDYCRLRFDEWYAQMARNRRHWKERYWAALLLVVLGSSWFVANQTGGDAAKSWRNNILKHAMLAGSAVDRDKANQLSWGYEDLESRNYHDLKRWLSVAQETIPGARFAYLTGYLDGKCYILVDSEQPDSPNYSPPGQRYVEATPLFLAALAGLKPCVTGPEKDRWGTFVTGTCPVLNRGPEEGVISFNLDVDANLVNRTVYQARLPILIITLLVAVLLMILAVAWHRIRLSSILQALELERTRNQELAMARLGSSKTIASGDFSAAIAEITQTAAVTLRVERASVWLYEAAGNKISCADLFELSRGTHQSGSSLDAGCYPAHFETLKSGRVINAPNAQSDPRLQGFLEDYLKPFHIAALLDAPVRLDGQWVGIVCFEHVECSRLWMDDEARFASEIADEVAHAMLSERRKQADDLLAASERRFREFVDFLPQVVFEADLAGRLVFVNRAAYSMTGYQPEDLKDGVNVFQICHPSAHGQLRNNLRELTIGRPEVGHEYPIVRKDGTQFLGLVYSSLKQEPNGNLFRGIVIDITERKHAEEALRESEKRLSQIINFLPDATFVIDLDGRVTHWNRAMEVMTGVPAKKILGKGDREYSLPLYGCRCPILVDIAIEPTCGHQNRYLKIDHKGDHVVGESFAPCLGEHGTYLWGMARALHDSEEQLVGAIESIRDISDLRQAENRLRRAHEELAAACDSQKKLLQQQEVNIDLARQVLAVINSSPPRHVQAANHLNFFIASRHIPCHAEGGDHFFVRDLPAANGSNRRLVISLKDQSGHEVGCILRSIMTDLLHNALLRHQDGLSLGQTVSRLNDAVCASGLFREDDFFTAIIAEINPDTLDMQLLSAGHPAALLIRGTRVIRLPDESGPGSHLPIGLVGGKSYTADYCQLSPGDKLLFYTDGLLEIPRSSGRHILSSVQLHQLVGELVASHDGIPVSRLMEELFAALNSTNPPPETALAYSDDVAVIGVELECGGTVLEEVLRPANSMEFNACSRRLMALLEEEWRARGFESPESRLRLVMEEALLNAWKHGNKEDPAKEIRVRRHYANDARIEISDQGSGFDYRAIYDPTSYENLAKPSGRGLFIIRLLSNEVRWEDNGRTLVVSFERHKNPGQDREQHARMNLLHFLR